MISNSRFALFILFFSLGSSSLAQEMLRTYEFNTSADTRVTTVLFAKNSHARDFNYTLLPHSKPNRLSVQDLSNGMQLSFHRHGTQLAIVLPAARKDRAEVRLSIVEMVAAEGQSFSQTLEKGRYVFTLPSGFELESCSLPAQVQDLNGHVTVGVVQASTIRAPLKLAMVRASQFAENSAQANLRALDNRVVTYELQDPSTHQIRLWLEMYVLNPGQSHFYSQLRLEDNTSNPITLDVDHGDELPTRIISGKEANSIGDAPSAFPENSRVLVADLGYHIPQNGSARLRSFQTATDAKGYRLTGANEFRLDRFLARTDNRYVLPPGWSLAYTDQPAEISRDENNRVVLDFVVTGKAAVPLTIIGERTSATQIQK